MLTIHFCATGLFHGLKEVASNEKLRGLYRGIGPTLLAIAPFMAVQQASYDVLKQQATKLQLEPSAPLFFVCGSVAGGIAQTVSLCYPTPHVPAPCKTTRHAITLGAASAHYLEKHI
jgi:hypothetical protein